MIKAKVSSKSNRLIQEKLTSLIDMAASGVFRERHDTGQASLGSCPSGRVASRDRGGNVGQAPERHIQGAVG